MRCAVFAALAIFWAGAAGADAEVSPRRAAIAGEAQWELYEDAVAEGRLADLSGGVRSRASGDLAALLYPDAAREPGPWLAPLARLSLFADAASEYDRAYARPGYPVWLAGGPSLTCEYQQGRPCGDGAGLAFELDSAAGVSTWLRLGSRLRVRPASTSQGAGFDVDRAFLRFNLGPAWLQVGRDALSVGPAVRSEGMLSTNAAPLDGLQLGLHPLALTPWLRASLFYTLDVLRDPQTFSGTLFDLSRLQVDLFDHLQLGGSRILQLGGAGAPDYGGLWGFVNEHFGRSVRQRDGGSENNRLALDAALRLPLLGARLYAELTFEDTRSPFFNSAVYDADHLLGLELRAGLPGPLRRVFIEYLRTSRISQEHGTFTTGLTNAGRTLGSALGPDALSLWLRMDLALGLAQVSPWCEWLRYSSDLYSVTDADGVSVNGRGAQEHRQRAGVDARFEVLGLGFSGGLLAERIGGAGYRAGIPRFSAGGRLLVSWSPALP